MVFLESVLNPMFRPLLEGLGPLWFIVVVSLVITLLITLVYKFVTDQAKMKELKDEMKGYQKQMKDLKEEPAKIMELQKIAMKKNLEYMKHSFKPTIITILPIILIFGWLNANLAFEPLGPGAEFGISAVFEEGMTGKAVLVLPEEFEIVGEAEQKIKDEAEWKVKAGKEGNYVLDVEFGDETFSKEILITKQQAYAEQIKSFKNNLKKIVINYEKLRPLGSFSIFGWQPGWLGLYIILSLVLSMVLRKIFKLH